MDSVDKKLHPVLGMMQETLITTYQAELFRNDRLVSRVGLNLISQHIKLRVKTNKYSLFSPFTTYT